MEQQADYKTKHNTIIIGDRIVVREFNVAPINKSGIILAGTKESDSTVFDKIPFAGIVVAIGDGVKDDGSMIDMSDFKVNSVVILASPPASLDFRKGRIYIDQFGNAYTIYRRGDVIAIWNDFFDTDFNTTEMKYNAINPKQHQS